jgi:hypothetical protein
VQWLGELVFQAVFEFLTSPVRRWLDRKIEAQRRKARRVGRSKR